MTSRSRPVSFAITAATFTGNHGAEAMLLATMDSVRARLGDAHFSVFSYYPAQDRAVIDDPMVEVFSLTPVALVFRLAPLTAAYALVRALGLTPLLRAFPADVRALADVTAQLDLAGVSFVEGREKFLPFNVLTLVPAFLLGVPVVKLSQAMGPFHRALNRMAAKAALGRCTAIFARGAESLEHVRSLGLRKPVILGAPDVAFLLEPDGEVDPPSAERLFGTRRPLFIRWPENRLASALAEITQARPTARRVVGVCPSSLLSVNVGPAYVRLMADVVTALVEAGDRVVLFPHASRGSADAGPRNNDLYVLRQLTELLPPAVLSGVTLVDEDLHAPHILRLLSHVDMAVVSRFHAMVGCLSVGRPVVVVGWSHKYAEVMDAFGLSNHVLDGRSATAADVLGSLNTFREDPQHFSEHIADRLRTMKAAAGEPFDFVSGLAGGHAQGPAADAGRAVWADPEPTRREPAQTPQTPSTWQGIKRASQVIWLLLVAAFTVRFALRHGQAFLALDVGAGLSTWVVALAWILSAKVAISLMVADAWRAAGADMGLGPAIYTYNLSQLPKYLPGGVWPYVSRIQMARARALELPRIGGGLALETAFLLGGALALAAVAVDMAPLLEGAGLGPWSAWIPWLRATGLAALAVGWLTALRRAQHRMPFLRATLLALVAWACIGLSFVHVVNGVSSAPAGMAVAGLFALAWGVGFVAVFSPAGLGVREAILGLGLASWGAPAVVAAMVVGHRLLYVAADVLCALCARVVFPPADPS